MGADSQDMINRLMLQVASQNTNPTFAGLQAPVDPAKLQNALSNLQQQNYVNSVGNANSDDLVSLFANAGKKDAARLGQNIAGLVGIGQPPAQQQAPQSSPILPPPGGMQSAPAPTLNPGQSSVTNNTPANDPIKAMMAASVPMASVPAVAQQIYRTALSQGQAPDQANLTALGYMAQQGFKGADEKLSAAQEAQLKNQATAAGTAKDLSQSNMDDASIKEKSFQQGGQTWHFVSQQDGVALYQNANGEPKVVTLQPSKTLPPAPISDAQSAARDAMAQKIANYDLQLGTAVGRGGQPVREDMLGRVLAINPDFDEKNWKQSQDALKAYGPAGTQGQMILKTMNAMNHLAALSQYHAALNNGDVQGANDALNSIGQQFGMTAQPTYAAIAPIVASEVSGALVKGGGGVNEREDRSKAIGAQLSQPQADAAINGMRSLLGAQYRNNQHLYEQTTLRHDFEQRFPVDGGFPSAPGVSSPTAPSTAPRQLPPTNPAGWTLHQDAQGNKAYVSPDGKQFQAVQ